MNAQRSRAFLGACFGLLAGAALLTRTEPADAQDIKVYPPILCIAENPANLRFTVAGTTAVQAAATPTVVGCPMIRDANQITTDVVSWGITVQRGTNGTRTWQIFLDSFSQSGASFKRNSVTVPNGALQTFNMVGSRLDDIALTGPVVISTSMGSGEVIRSYFITEQ